MELRRRILDPSAGEVVTDDVVPRCIESALAVDQVDLGHRARTSLEVRADRVVRRIGHVRHHLAGLDLVGQVDGGVAARVEGRATDLGVRLRVRAEEVADGGEVLVGASQRHVGDRRLAVRLQQLDVVLVRVHDGRAHRIRRRGEGEESSEHEAQTEALTHAFSLDLKVHW